MRKQLGILVFALAVACAVPAQAATYEIDAGHSSVEFKIRHLVSSVRGSFNQFEGTFDYEPDKPQEWKTKAVIQAESIDTNVGKRDEHLRSADFFDVEKYPTLSFESTGISDATAESAKLSGNLTIHGVTKPVVFDLEIHGVTKDMRGTPRAGFTATTTVNRKDFGLTWNKVLEAGKVMVGEEVQITIEIEGALKA
jgi:polyisoprenoid-binding protein YceI